MTEQGGQFRIDPAMLRHYASGAELGRLEHVNVLEFERTKLLLEEALPRTGRIIDVGGGPGVYSHWLAARGYDVDLVDPVPLHVAQAEALGAGGQRFRAVLGDARDLPFPDAVADAVVLMGPLFHLTEEAERQAALSEAFRVLRPQGVLAATAMGRFFLVFKEVAANGIRDERVLERMVRITDTGHRANADGGPFPAYSHLPGDLDDEVRGAGFTDVRLHAVEGFFNLLGDLSHRMADEPSRRALLEVLARFGDHPALLGVSGHLMAVARRP